MTVDILVYQLDSSHKQTLDPFLKKGRKVWFLFSSRTDIGFSHPNLRQLSGAEQVERRNHTALDRAFEQIPLLLQSPYFTHLRKPLQAFIQSPHDRFLLSTFGFRRLAKVFEIDEALKNSGRSLDEFELIPSPIFDDYGRFKRALQGVTDPRVLPEWKHLPSLFAIWAKIWVKLFVPARKTPRRNYRYSALIISEDRHSHENQKAYNAMFADSRFKPEEILFFPFQNLSEGFKSRIQSAGYSLQPRLGFFSKRLMPKALTVGARIWTSLWRLPTSDLLELSDFFSDYLYWETLLDQVTIQNFVAMSGYTLDIYIRNAVMSARGTQTWFFPESASFPDWLYLKGRPTNRKARLAAFFLYDHFVSWNRQVLETFKESGARFENEHIVGCVWSTPNQKRAEAQRPSRPLRLTVFDTYYPPDFPFGPEHREQFYRDILRLLREVPEIELSIKPKFPPHIHQQDRRYQSALQEFLQELKNFPNAKVIPGGGSTVEGISGADFVVTCFSSSVSVEAAGSGKPAILYEPFERYRGSLMDEVPGFFRHGYDELKSCIQDFIATGKLPCDPASSVFHEKVDAFQDGKGMERLRDLLISKG